MKADDDRRLFAESAGTCLLCNKTLFPDSRNSDRSISIAERAHVISHSDQGPRADPTAGTEFRESIANLVLLCPSCHTMVDKDPEGHTDEELFQSKKRRASAVARVGGTPTFESREAAWAAVSVLLQTNKAVFDCYGPDPDTGSVAGPEAASGWRQRVIDDIIPNNRLIVAMVEVNSALATDEDIRAAAELSAHTDDLERKHRIERPLMAPSQRFPESATRIFSTSELDKGRT